ncbi:MAG: AraC family transcriptional regulator [Nannocystaceae bacterium]
MGPPPPLDPTITAAWSRWFGGLQRATWSRLEDELRLLRARDFIDRCYDRPLDLEAIARQACFSRYHFLRAFRRAYAITPHQYLTQRRIDRARDLLEAGELSVTDVCLAVGFQSLGSFSTLFRRHVGRSPADYRRTLVQCPGLWRARAPIPTCFLHHYRLVDARGRELASSSPRR